MNTNIDYPDDELLTRAEGALKSLTVPEGPDDAAMQRILAAVREEAADTAPPAHAVPAQQWRWWNKQVIGFSAVLAATVLVTLGLSLTSPRESLALDDLMRPFREAKTVVYETMVMPDDGSKESANRSKWYHSHTGQSRTEHEDGSVTTIDPDKRVMVTLVPKTNTALVMTDMQRPEIPNIPSQAAAVIQWLGQAEASGEGIGIREIDGVSARGYRVQTGPVLLSIWGDPKTKLPLLVEMPVRVQDQEYTLQMSNFQFNVPLDDSLFSTDPPAGYQVQRRKAPAADLSLVGKLKPEEHVVRLLKFYSALFDGQFPKQIDDPGLVATITSRLSKNGEMTEEDEASLYEIVPSMGALWTFRQSLEGFGYAGDVKLGEKDRMVFWYRPANTDEFQVVYGDLRIESVPADQVPKGAK